MVTCTCARRLRKKNVIQKLATGSESNLVSAIFNNMEVKIRKSLEILTKFNTKTLLYSTLLYCTLFFASKILENIVAHKQN